MDSSSSWIDVDGMQTSSMDEPVECCPIPAFRPNLQPPASLKASEGKAELHRVLQAVQCSTDFGVYLCESFRDPRRYYIDDYWQDVQKEAIGIQEMHKLVGKIDNTPLADEARARFHQLARLLERLSRRIDRVVLAA